MAKIRYKRVPEPVLLDLQEVDLHVLHLALAALIDSYSAGKVTLSDYEHEALEQLDLLVNTIRLGEASVEDTGSELQR